MKTFFILIISLSLYIGNENILAGEKINEGFEGNQFPPEGWSILNPNTLSGEWKSSIRTPVSGNKCAVSNFTPEGSNNFIVTKRFTADTGDSLVFYFKQTFWNNYKDTFNVFVSTSDSLLTTKIRLFNFVDNISYPDPTTYGRYAVSLDSYAGQTIWIGFQHSNIDGDNIRLDNIYAGQPGYSEVGVTSNVYPSGILNSCLDNKIIPRATIKNFGTIDQVLPFNITYKISGSSFSYTCVRQDTISAGITKTIYFDTAMIEIPGVYNIKIYTGLASDNNHLNDTLNSIVTVLNPNFGGGLISNGNYYFANSSQCTLSESQTPQFNWKDTSGSTSLILNGEDLSGGLLTGTIDNGFFSLGHFLPPGNKIKVFDIEYDSIFITTNGVLAFSRNNVLLSSNPAQIGLLMSQPVAAFSPLWMDFDFVDGLVPENRLSYKIAGNQLIITFDKAPLKNGGESDYVSFQICIQSGNALTQNSRLLTAYNQEHTGDSFINKYYNNTLPPHLIGMKNTYGNKYLIYRFTDSNGVSVNGPMFNSSLAVAFGPDINSLNSRVSTLDISVLLEAISPHRDTITVSLRDSRIPYSILESRKIFQDTNSSGECQLSIPENNYDYYIVINHRNSIETWSRAGGESFDGFTLNYDFTDNASKAYGGNLLMKAGRAYIYSGDVNQDDIVDGDDIISLFNGVNSFYTGYVPEDLNYDGSVDLDDLLVAYNNNSRFVTLKNP